jgi:hypothetical protein
VVQAVRGFPNILENFGNSETNSKNGLKIYIHWGELIFNENFIFDTCNPEIASF